MFKVHATVAQTRQHRTRAREMCATRYPNSAPHIHTYSEGILQLGKERGRVGEGEGKERGRRGGGSRAKKAKRGNGKEAE